MKRLRGERGTTIVEALVAAAIFAICAAAISSLLSASFKRTRSNALRNQALLLAADELETLRAMPYGDIAALGASHSASVPRLGVPFTVARTIATNAPAASMSTIGVSVSWTERGHARSERADVILTGVER